MIMSARCAGPYEHQKTDHRSGAPTSLPPRALERLVCLPLLDAGDVIAGEGLAVLAWIAFDPGEYQAVRLARAALPGLEQHFAGHRRPLPGVAVVVDHRRDVPDRASGCLG